MPIIANLALFLPLFTPINPAGQIIKKAGLIAQYPLQYCVAERGRFELPEAV